MNLEKGSILDKTRDPTTKKAIYSGWQRRERFHIREGTVGNDAVGIGGTLVLPCCPSIRSNATLGTREQGRWSATEVGIEGSVTWRGLASSFHLLYRPCEVWAHGNRLVYPDICLTRRDSIFFAGDIQLAWEDKTGEQQTEYIDDVPCFEVRQQRLGAIVTRTRVVIGKQVVGVGKT